MESTASFGYWVRRRRKALDLTQQALGDRVGCTAEMIKKIEADARRPSHQLAELLATHLALEPDVRPAFLAAARAERATDRLALTTSPLDPPSVWPNRSRRAQALEPGQRHTLPDPRIGLVGRTYELEQLIGRLNDPATRLLSIVGPGGIGKTRLALAVGERLTQLPAAVAGSRPDVAFVSLEDVGEVQGIAIAIGEALGVRLHDAVPHHQQLAALLSSRDLVLILDTVEHLLPVVDQLLELVRCAPDLKLLVTSREPLNVQAEQVYLLGGLPFPARGASITQGSEESAAIQLFVAHARRIAPGFDLAREREAVTTICQLVEGSPLAIELTAAWVGRLPCAQIAAEIRSSLDLLTTRLRDVPERHRSMRAVFESSWQLLTPDERILLLQLGVFEGGWRQEDAEQVANAAIQVTMALMEKSLVESSPSGRYRMHGLLRQFVQDKQREQPDLLPAAQQRHASYYLQWLRQREGLLADEHNHATVREVYDEFENVRTAWNWAVAHDERDLLAGALEALYRSLIVRGRYREAEALIAGALRRIPAQERLLGRLQARYGGCLVLLGQAVDACFWLDQAIASAQHHNDASERAFALTMRGEAAAWLGRPVDAAARFRESLAVSRARADRSAVAETLHYFANVCWLTGEGAEAQRLAEEHYALAHLMHSQSRLAHALNNLGFVAFTRGDYAHAEQHFRESISIAEALDEPLTLSVALSGLAWCSGALGDMVLAQTMAERSVGLARSCGHRLLEAVALSILGQTVEQLGTPEKALQIYDEGLMIARQLAAPLPMLLCLNGLVSANQLLGDHTRAINNLRETLATGMVVQLPALVLLGLVLAAQLIVAARRPLVAATQPDDMRLICALEWLAHVEAHPASWRVARDQAARLRAIVEPQLPAWRHEAACERGRQLMLVDAVASANTCFANLLVVSAPSVQ